MGFDVVQFYRDYRITYIGQGHKHCRPGWIQIPCPYCTGNPGYHLGFNTRQGFYTCWRCGWKSPTQVIQTLTGCDWRDSKLILKTYGGKVYRLPRPDIKVGVRKINVQLPFGSEPLKKQHKKYLANRGFDPKELVDLWGLRGTGPLGDYRYRIIAPIMFRGKLVSYQGRDYTGKSGIKYMACAQENEAIDHHRVLYGYDHVPNDGVIIVEGITDVWKLGPGAVGTFGVKFTAAQIKLLKEYYYKYIMYDSSNDDPQAIKQAESLAGALSAFEGEVEIIELDSGDPGDLDRVEAQKIRKELIGWLE